MFLRGGESTMVVIEEKVAVLESRPELEHGGKSTRRRTKGKGIGLGSGEERGRNRGRGNRARVESRSRWEKIESARRESGESVIEGKRIEIWPKPVLELGGKLTGRRAEAVKLRWTKAQPGFGRFHELSATKTMVKVE
ncbi:hypothetical protein KM043_001965 [Ampulex compressa]|nr:hypothetical protein KM043_001965 [Ampulex compressa]